MVNCLVFHQIMEWGAWKQSKEACVLFVSDNLLFVVNKTDLRKAMGQIQMVNCHDYPGMGVH